MVSNCHCACAPITFSVGSKIGYSYSPGFPHMRIVNGQKFAEMRGFQLVHQIFKSEYWPGSDVLRPLLKLLDSPEVGLVFDDFCHQ